MTSGVVKWLKPALDIASRLAAGPTRAHATTKTLLAAWSGGGVRAADEAMIEQVSTLVATADAVAGVASAAKALEAGRPRPEIEFSGN